MTPENLMLVLILLIWVWASQTTGREDIMNSFDRNINFVTNLAGYALFVAILFALIKVIEQFVQ